MSTLVYHGAACAVPHPLPDMDAPTSTSGRDSM